MDKFLDIKFKKPKSCAHCSAWMDGGSHNQSCLLGFRTERLSNGKSIQWNLNYFDAHHVVIKPIGKCLKPKTHRECSNISRNMPSFDFFYNAT